MRSSVQRWLVVLVSGATSLVSMVLAQVLAPAANAASNQDTGPSTSATPTPAATATTPAPKPTQPVPQATKTKRPKPAKSEPAPTAVAGAMKDGTYSGGSFSAGSFGTVKVTITVAGGQITKVSTPSLPSRDRESQRINQQAGPYLRDQAIGVKSAADIAGVTGASYTTSAFRKSLQDAINKSKK